MKMCLKLLGDGWNCTGGEDSSLTANFFLCRGRLTLKATLSSTVHVCKMQFSFFCVDLMSATLFPHNEPRYTEQKTVESSQQILKIGKDQSDGRPILSVCVIPPLIYLTPCNILIVTHSTYIWAHSGFTLFEDIFWPIRTDNIMFLLHCAVRQGK